MHLNFAFSNKIYMTFVMPCLFGGWCAIPDGVVAGMRRANIHRQTLNTRALKRSMLMLAEIGTVDHYVIREHVMVWFCIKDYGICLCRPTRSYRLSVDEYK